MRVFAVVNGYTGALCLRELLAQGHEVVGVVTSPPSRPNDNPAETVLGVASERLLPLYFPSSEEVAAPSPAFLDLFRQANPDLLMSMHYAAIFKPVVLAIPPLGAVNIHPSRLPEGRGMTPSFWYLYLGRDTAWTSLHYLDPGIDSGDVIAHASAPIAYGDTGASVGRKLSEAARDAFREHLPGIAAGTAPRQKQDLSQGKGTFLRSGFDWNLIRWSREAKAVRGQIRCFTNTPNPARTRLAGETLTVNDAEVLEAGDRRFEREGAEPGEVVALTGQGPVVQTGSGQVVLTDCALRQPEAGGAAAPLFTNTRVVLG